MRHPLPVSHLAYMQTSRTLAYVFSLLVGKLLLIMCCSSQVYTWTFSTYGSL